MLRVLVTGAGGFTGRELTKHLVSHGYSVRGMVRNAAAARDVASLGAEPVIADLNDAASLSNALAGIKKVFHVAALFRQAGFPASEYHRVNVEGTRNLLDLGIKAGVEFFVHCSTVGVLGHIENPPATESTPYNPGDPYQDSKTEGEKLFLRYVRDGRIKGLVIRPAMIWGPGDTRTLKLFARIAERRFVYVGPGQSLVHFIDVRDLAQAFRLASERLDLSGELFIVAGETALPLAELVWIVSSLMGVPEPWLHLPVKPMQLLGSLCEAIFMPFKINPPIFRRRVDFFTKDRNFDCSKARDVLGFEPSKGLVEELLDIIDSYCTLGAIDAARIERPSVFLRSVEGRIVKWSRNAQDVYGWDGSHAIGEVSHRLLDTRFPEDISQINKRLNETGIWRGLLTHRTRDGSEVQVLSKWKLLRSSTGDSPLVLEINNVRGGLTQSMGALFTHGTVSMATVLEQGLPVGLW